MAFGFNGKPATYVVVELAGVINGTNRDFMSRHGAIDSNVYGKLVYDIEEASATKADQQVLDNGAAIAYNGRPLMLLSTSVGFMSPWGTMNIGGTNFSYNYAIGYQGLNPRYYRYTTNGTLTPTTRKVRHELPYYRTKVFQLHHGFNTTPTATNNSATGTLVINAHQWPNLESLELHEIRATVVTLRMDTHKKLKSVYLREWDTVTVTLTGKIPSSVESVGIMQLGAGVTSVATLLSEATGIKILAFGQHSGSFEGLAVPHINLSGALDISHLVNLKEFLLPNNPSLTSLVVPSGKSDWEIFWVNQLPTAASTAFLTARLDEILSSASLRVFAFTVCSKTYVKAIGNTEISANLIGWLSYNNSWSGNISITTAKVNLRVFKTGNQNIRSGSQQNSHPIVNLTGLTGAREIDISGSNVEDLQLPVNTVMTELYLIDNKLDIVTNPNLVSQINAITSLVTLSFSRSNTSTAGANGQTSTNGLGANPDFSGLVNMTTFRISNCKVTGNLILPNVNKITAMECYGNTGMTGITNFSAHTSLSSLRALDCDSLNLSLSHLTSYTQIIASKWLNTTIDISGRTSSTTFNVAGGMAFNDMPNLTTITLPSVAGRFTFAGQSFTVSGNPLLTTINNISNVGITAAGINFNIRNNASLNIAFPFSATLRPTQVDISNNALNTANVDASISNYYAIRASLPVGSKTFNIGGAGNAAASGIYQAPSGFVLGSSDGSPASAKEMLYVLANNYSTSVIYN